MFFDKIHPSARDNLLEFILGGWGEEKNICRKEKKMEKMEEIFVAMVLVAFLLIGSALRIWMGNILFPAVFGPIFVVLVVVWFRRRHKNRRIGTELPTVVDEEWEKEHQKGRPCCGGGWDTYFCPECDGTQQPPVPGRPKENAMVKVVVISARKLSDGEMKVVRDKFGDTAEIEFRAPGMGCAKGTWIDQNNGLTVVMVDPPTWLAVGAGYAMGHWSQCSDHLLPVFYLEDGKLKP